MGIAGGILMVVLIINAILPFLAFCSVPSIMQTNSSAFKCCLLAYAILNTLVFVNLFLYFIFSFIGGYNVIRVLDYINAFEILGIYVMTLVIVPMASFDELCDE